MEDKDKKIYRYAIVDADGNITNVSLWDGKTPWQPPEGHKAIKDEENKAEIGGKYDGKKFLPPINK